MKDDYIKGTATFVMAHWRQDNDASRIHLEEAIDGICRQTDDNWQLVIIDDKSPCQEAIEYLKIISEKNPEKIKVIFKETNDGPGICRNIGIEWAYKHNSHIILFNDADDISDPKRLETVRRIFCENPEANVVYSTFSVIDENSNPVNESKLTPSILEILEGHKNNPIQGKNAWILIGTELGYTNLTSSPSVKTAVAYKYPFPSERVSEDQHAWLRYSAGGGCFIYSGDIPSLYRIPQGTPTVSRSRINEYYVQKAEVDTKGFLEAIRIAEENGSIPLNERDDLLISFYVKLAETLGREQEYELANQQIVKATAISKEKTRKVLEKRKLDDRSWACVGQKGWK